MTLGIFIALAAAGQAVSAAPAAPSGTLQQRFDAASDAAMAPRRCGEAVALFEAIEANGAVSRKPLVAAAINVRKGRCLVLLKRDAEGTAAIRRGLPELESRGAPFAGDVRDGRLMLGIVANRALDWDAAVAEYEKALAASRGAERLQPLLQLAGALMFDHDGRALRYAEEARTIAAATTTLDKRDIANVQTVYARVLLNEGRDKEAYAILRDSLTKQGGLDLHVAADDIATRSDLAIAALRNKDVEGARKYLAYTGAGRMANSPFTRAAAMDLPACDPAIGLTPDDVAIVEFSIEDDGHVSTVSPIFSTGRREAALTFARSVADWSWRPEDVKTVPMLFRYMTRVELRCLRAPEAPGIGKPLADAADEWFDTHGAANPSWADLPAAQAVGPQRAAAAGSTALALRAAFDGMDNPVLKEEDRRALAARAAELSVPLDAPLAIRTSAAFAAMEVKSAGQYRAALRDQLANPAVAADPLVANTLRLRIAAPYDRTRPPEDAAALLEAVIASPLPERHPLRTAALLQLANIRAAANDQAGAQAAFARTGLSAEQCALIGLVPAQTRTGASSGSYPMAAMAMGFEGWTRTEFDVTADGRTAAPRVVAAYPPFVFDEAAVGIARGARYAGSFRPEGALACAGQQQSVRFLLP